jgi:hypothetical protein
MTCHRFPSRGFCNMQFTGTIVLRLEKGKIAEEIGLHDGVTALRQLGLIAALQSDSRRWRCRLVALLRGRRVSVGTGTAAEFRFVAYAYARDGATLVA